MKIEKNINYKHIGDVLYRKNRRAKNISIRINVQGDIRVTVPGWCSYHRAEEFVLQKEEWIVKKVDSLKRKTKDKLAWKAGDSILFLYGEIRFIQGKSIVIEEMQVGNDYIIELPPDYDPADSFWKEKLLDKLGEIGKQEAKLHLPIELERLAGDHNLNYCKLTIRRMHTRWGSCSSKNNISLNSGLIFLPRELMEYVCLHELVHTIHKNHSAAFWNALELHLPGAYKLKRQLRDHAIIA